MEMVSIPLEQYQEFLQMRLELHLIYTKCSEEVAYDTGTYVADLMRILHPDRFPAPPTQRPVMPMKVPEVMPMLNSCDFQGRFAADPELRTTQTGKQVASFRMAVDRDMVDANGHRPTDWLTFTAWGKTAEFVSKYFRKGSAAVVHSRCQTRQYEDKNGNNRTAIEFVVDNIYFAGPKQDNQQGTVDDGGTNPPPATYRNQQPQPQQMGFATQSQRQQWQGAADHPGNVQVSQSFSQGSDDDFSVLDDADDLPF